MVECGRLEICCTHRVPGVRIPLSPPEFGYGQSGQIISAPALLEKDRRPSDADIDDAMAGNICRCGTYVRIRAAIHEAANALAALG